MFRVWAGEKFYILNLNSEIAYAVTMPMPPFM